MFAHYRTKRPGTPLFQMLFYGAIRRFVRVLFAIVYRARIIGAENVPRSGPLLLVANHQSYLDPPLVGSTVYTRHIDFIARMGLFKFSGFFGWFIATLNSIPIKEEGSDTAAIKEVLRRLEDGRAVLIFPEGSRSETGRMDDFKRGVAVLVKRSRCPVLPIAVEGCYDAWPRGTSRPRLFGARVAIHYGDPISHEDLMANGADQALVRLHDQINEMRRALREDMRRATNGKYPPVGAADQPTPATG